MNGTRLTAPNAASDAARNRYRERAFPYVACYDVTLPKRANRVRACLARWRIDGQKSVYETHLLPHEAVDLAADLLELLDAVDDSALLCRLPRRGAGSTAAAAFRLRDGPSQVWLTSPAEARGCWLIAYDVTSPQRLNRAQRVAARHCAQLQRSVYVFQGAASALIRLWRTLEIGLDATEDDLRAYPIRNSSSVWVLAGTVIPVSGLFASAQ